MGSCDGDLYGRVFKNRPCGGIVKRGVRSLFVVADEEDHIKVLHRVE